jgi:hypothetical protein
MTVNFMGSRLRLAGLVPQVVLVGKKMVGLTAEIGPWSPEGWCQRGR